MLALCAVAFCACGEPEHDPVPPAEIAAVRLEWYLAGLPALRCSSAYTPVRVVGDDAIRTFCGRDPADVAGCYARVREGYDRPAIIVGDRYAGDVGLDVHEIVHWAAWCSGIWTDADGAHADARLWGPGGVRERATVRLLGP